MQLLMELHEDADAHGADISDAGEVEPDPVSPLAHDVFQSLCQMIGPVPVQTADDRHIHKIARSLRRYFHCYS